MTTIKYPICRKHSLHTEFILSYWYTISKLYGTPEPVKLSVIICTDHTVRWRLSVPDWIIQEGTNLGQGSFENRESTAKFLSG